MRKLFCRKDLDRVELLQDRIGGSLKRFVRLPLDRKCLIKTRQLFSVTQLRPTTVLKITHAWTACVILVDKLVSVAYRGRSFYECFPEE